MNNWKIKSLYYGKINVPRGVMAAGLDPELMIDIPYIGYLLQNGKENVLVDTGIHQDNIVDGRAWGGYTAVGGNQYVLPYADWLYDIPEEDSRSPLSMLAGPFYFPKPARFSSAMSTPICSTKSRRR